MGRSTTNKDTLFRRAKAARGETAEVDFKAAFDSRCWPEVVKDLVAMANSGGGALIFGVDDDGHTSHADLTEISRLDPAALSDQIRKFTGSPFADVEIRQATRRGGAPAVLVLVGGVDVPLIFEKPGTYADPDRSDRQKTAFARGSLYIRHGAKSETATNADMVAATDRAVDDARRRWLADVSKVVEAPRDAEVRLVRVSHGETDDDLRVQLVDDPDAPIFGRLNPDQTHPYRQKELIERLNARLPDGVTVNTHDLLCIRRCYDLDGRAKYVWHPRFGSPQYSDHFVDWLLEEHASDQGFFATARAEYRAERRGQTFAT